SYTTATFSHSCLPVQQRLPAAELTLIELPSSLTRRHCCFPPPQLVSLLLIGVGAWGKWFDLVSSIRVVAGVIGVGIFLFLVAFVGLCGALKHNQVLLFFYMVILFIVFVVQFSVSCACLSLRKDQQDHLLEVGWNKSEATQRDVEKTLDCCGFFHINYNDSCPASLNFFSSYFPSPRDAFTTHLSRLVKRVQTPSSIMQEKCFGLWAASDSSSVLR
ncbi:hypothetical protein L3Q82_013491, partial [Scortum barcoo]